MDYEEADMASKAVSKRDAKHGTNHNKDRDPGDCKSSKKEYSSRRFNEHTKLNTTRAEILVECANVEFHNIKRPEPLVLKEGQKLSRKYCRYHKNNRHDTNDCMALKDDIEEQIRKGKLSQYIKKGQDDPKENKRRSASPHRSPKRSPRKGKLVVNEVTKKGKKDGDDSEEEDVGKAKTRPVAMVIFGGCPIEGKQRTGR